MKKDLFLIAFLLALTSMLVAQTFDIRHFGARGDGKTTDTRAIQAAVDSTAAQGGALFTFLQAAFAAAPSSCAAISRYTSRPVLSGWAATNWPIMTRPTAI